LEVLVSIGILTLGVLGVAMLIPIGKFAMTEVEKSDRTGTTGRAGLREVKVRGMLNVAGWGAAPADAVNVAIIDPLGTYEGGTAPGVLGPLGGVPIGGTTTFGGTMTGNILARFSLTNVANAANAEAAFLCHDDLAFVLPKDANPPQQGDRPTPPIIGGVPATGQFIGNFSWFFTVAGSPADYHPGPPVTGTPWVQRQLFSVSVVVCWKRNFKIAIDGRNPAPEGEQSCAVKYDPTKITATCNGFTEGFGYGGGTIALCDYPTDNNLDPNPSHPINKVREDQWVMLVGLDNSAPPVPIVGAWYRVVGVSREQDVTNHPSQPVNMLSLVGPDWAANSNVQFVNVVVIDGVTGVYSSTVQVDNDMTWSR
jgi:hypothetical protein